jgi:hypothetical protein
MTYSKEQWFGVVSALNPNAVIEKEKQWGIQWRRVQRWFERTNAILKKSEKEELIEDDFDIIIAFFQNCYHLRDWLISSKPELKDNIKNLFDDNFEMGACRDICNGYKHKKLTNPSHDPDFALYREYDHFQAEAEPSKQAILYNIVFDYENDIRKYNIFDLANRCYNLWEQFIKNNC